MPIFSATARLSPYHQAQRIFCAAGAVPLLLQLLNSGKANTSAAKALAKLLSPAPGSDVSNSEVQREIASNGGIPPLLALLSSMNSLQQTYAAETLAKLACGNVGSQDLIAKAGGIGPLLSMLASKSVLCQVTSHNGDACAAATNHMRVRIARLTLPRPLLTSPP